MGYFFSRAIQGIIIPLGSLATTMLSRRLLATQVSVPTLLIHGSEDDIAYPSGSEKMKGLLTGCSGVDLQVQYYSIPYYISMYFVGSACTRTIIPFVCQRVPYAMAVIYCTEMFSIAPSQCKYQHPYNQS